MKLFIRVAVLFLIQEVIKAGDSSFDGIFDFSARGTLFSAGFILYGLIVWYIAEYFNNLISSRKFPAERKGRTYALFAFNLVFGFIIGFLGNWLYQTIDMHFSQNQESVWKGVTFFNAELTVSLWAIYLMIFSFDNYHKFSLRNKEKQIKLEKLEKDKTLAQYLNLKAQIEPHFLFNSLSVLSSLIHTNREMASEFVLRLSKMLRFVIEKNNFLLISFEEEMSFVENYNFLIKTRFENEIKFNCNIDENIKKSRYVPPAAIQTLVENAVKHNKFTEEEPLTVEIKSSEDGITVTNNVNLRDSNNTTTGQGLKNLKARYSHFTTREVKIVQSTSDFSVTIPLLKQNEYENINF